jgi:hypothetical protein
MKKAYLFVLLGILVIGCGGSVLYLVSRSVIGQMIKNNDCKSVIITDSDVDYINNYRRDLFPESDWKRSYTVETNSTFVKWSSKSTSGAVSINNFILCDASLEKLKEHLNDKAIATMLRSFDQYDLLVSCQENNVILYDFEAMRNSRNYDIHMWVKPLEKRHHALAVVLVFLKDDSEIMDEYSHELFPELTSCR